MVNTAITFTKDGIAPLIVNIFQDTKNEREKAAAIAWWQQNGPQVFSNITQGLVHQIPVPRIMDDIVTVITNQTGFETRYAISDQVVCFQIGPLKRPDDS